MVHRKLTNFNIIISTFDSNYLQELAHILIKSHDMLISHMIRFFSYERLMLITQRTSLILLMVWLKHGVRTFRQYFLYVLLLWYLSYWPCLQSAGPCGIWIQERIASYIVILIMLLVSN